MSETKKEPTAIEDLLKAKGELDELILKAQEGSDAGKETELAKAKEAKKKKDEEEEEEEKEQAMKALEASSFEEILAKAADENSVLRANEAFGEMFDMLKSVIADVNADNVQISAKMDALVGIVGKIAGVVSNLAKAVSDLAVAPAVVPGDPAGKSKVDQAVIAKALESTSGTFKIGNEQFLKGIQQKLITQSQFSAHKRGVKDVIPAEVLTKIASL